MSHRRRQRDAGRQERDIELQPVRVLPEIDPVETADLYAIFESIEYGDNWSSYMQIPICIENAEAEGMVRIWDFHQGYWPDVRVCDPVLSCSRDIQYESNGNRHKERPVVHCSIAVYSQQWKYQRKSWTSGQIQYTQTHP